MSEHLSDVSSWMWSCAFACVCSDIEKVLREDKEKLRLLQKSQPRFSEEQKKELIEVHPWIKKGGLPKAIDIKVELNTYFRSDVRTPPITLTPHLHLDIFFFQMCSCCNDASEAATAAAEDQPDLDLGECETGEVSYQPSNPADTSGHGSPSGSRSQTQTVGQ